VVPGRAAVRRYALGYPVKARRIFRVVIGVKDDMQRGAGRRVLWRQLVTVSVKFWVTLLVVLVAVMAMA
jgi:hypothetical protein